MIDPTSPRVSTDELLDAKAKLAAAFQDFYVRMARIDGDLTERFVEYLNHLGAAAPPCLPWRQARVLALRYGKGLTHEQIAEELGISERTVQRDYREALESIAVQVREE